MTDKKSDRSYRRIFKSKYQKDKAHKLKSAAKNHTWNSLFIGQNAAAEAISQKFGVDKFDLVAGDGQNSAAVRMAMAETKLVKETHDFMQGQNVKLDKLSKVQSEAAERRSDTTIIVKNLAGGVDESELGAAFSVHGRVREVKISPGSGLSAIVEMENKLDARRAFNRLAYSCLSGQDQPLYLEWAPLDLNRASTFSVTQNLQGEEEEEDGKQSKILVRNVPFQATSEELTQLFSAFGELRAVRLPKKLGISGSSSHRGFCFVDYISPADAKRAFSSLSLSTHLYGRRLVLEWAKTETTVSELREKSANKLRSSKRKIRSTNKGIREAIKKKESSSSDSDT